MNKKLQEMILAARAKKEALEKAEPVSSPVSPAPAPAPATIRKETIQERIARMRGERQQPAPAPAPAPAPLEPKPPASEPPASEPENLLETHTGMDGSIITYNHKQQEFVNLMASGKSCVLIGAAGTGKTTCVQGSIAKRMQEHTLAPLQADGHKHLMDGSPGICIISYTRRAVSNIRKVLPEDLKSNAITCHKLLEYMPVIYEMMNEETGESYKTMRFEPSRNSINPLPTTLTTVIVEEASMLSLELFREIVAATPHPIQWVFIGDLNQLPPVFGSAILGYKLLELPVVELTEVYRQALESPIIRLAHRILSGKPIPATEYADWHYPNQLTIHPWKKKLHTDSATLTLAAFFKRAYDTNSFNPDEDMILIPFNKECGTIEINKHIANHIARNKNLLTYEVLAGFNKHYFSVGDKVLYDKEDAEITSIAVNNVYSGARTQPPSRTLDYWGHNPNIAEDASKGGGSGQVDDVDFLLDQAAAAAADEDRVTKASHVIEVRLLDSGQTIAIDKASEVNAMLHSYALTVHKSQGSEWRRVFLCLHQSHSVMLQRELLYTSVTRAKKELYVICEPESFTKGILNQKIKGNSLKEKAAFFRGKADQIAKEYEAEHPDSKHPDSKQSEQTNQTNQPTT